MRPFTALSTALTRSLPNDRPVLFALVRADDNDVPTRERVHAIGRERLTCALTGDIDEMLSQIKKRHARSMRKPGYVIDVDALATPKEQHLAAVLDRLSKVDAVTLVILDAELAEACATTSAWKRGTAWFDFTTGAEFV